MPTTSPHTTARVTFPGALGEDLAGVLHLPAGPARAFALFAHCFTCSKDSHAAARISAALAERGFGVLRFDFTGLGDSGGDFADSTFGSNVDDIAAAAAWMRARYESPQLLVGHSLGGAAVLAAAARIEGVVAVATLGAPASPDHVEHLITGTDTDEGDLLKVSIGGRPFRLRRQFLDDLRERAGDAQQTAQGTALLVMHCPQDQVIAVDNARQIFDGARHPKSFVSLDGADHLLSRRADSAYAAAVIAAWADRYVAVPDLDVAADEPAVLTVHECDPSGFVHHAQVRHHRWTVDEPESVGGADSGPTPYELLLAGLGACTSMTMRMYARRKGWEFGSTTVRLEHGRVHARDCADCEGGASMEQITREIEFDPAVTAEQRERLLVIAEKCPVHRTLEREVAVRTVVRAG
jgi:uncharacterized OsmC-like protein/alpha/beta superfamily hydrolase